MDIEDFKKKTLEGIDECEKRIKEYQNLIEISQEGNLYINTFRNSLNYWKGYQDCLKALDLHLKMEDLKEWANKECKNEFKD